MTPVRLKPTALQSGVKHSTTEPLRSHVFAGLWGGVCPAVFAGGVYGIGVLLYV